MWNGLDMKQLWKQTVRFSESQTYHIVVRSNSEHQYTELHAHDDHAISDVIVHMELYTDGYSEFGPQ